MFDRYRDNVDAPIGEIGRDEPQKPRRWVHDGLRRELVDPTDCGQTMVAARSIATNTTLYSRPLLDSKYIEVM